MTRHRIDLLDRLGFSWGAGETESLLSGTVGRIETTTGQEWKLPCRPQQAARTAHEQRLCLGRFKTQVPGNDSNNRMTAERAKALNGIGYTQTTRLFESESSKVATNMTVPGFE